MIIKLQDTDITSAQDNPDDEGVIHIPDAIWNHIIKEVERPDQTFVNSLYIDVKDLDIGGSGLPIVISSFNINNEFYGNTYDMLFKPSGEALTVTVPNGYVFFRVNINQDNWTLAFYYNNTGDSFNVSLVSSFNTRYYLSSGPVTGTSPNLYLYTDQNVPVFRIYDTVTSDSSSNQFSGYSSLVDFLWLTS